MRACVQMKHKFLFFTRWRNLRCRTITRHFPNAGFVTIDVSARCRGGSHTYRGVLYGYAAPPPGSDQVKSTKSLDARC